MTSLDELCEAIKLHKPVSFNYKLKGVRVGNPYAIYIQHLKDGSDSTKVHIVQTSGYSDSGQAFPSFRPFNIVDISDVKILRNEQSFEPNHPDYKPESSWYDNIIIKV